MALIDRVLVFSIVIGIIALILIYIFSNLVESVVVKEQAMYDRLNELNDRSFDGSRGGWDLFILELFTSAVILFAGGFTAAVFACTATHSLSSWLKASLSAACLPAILINIYLLIGWYNDVQLFYSTGMKNGRPFEPMVPPVVLLFVAMIMVYCIGLSLAGGWLASVAFKSGVSKGGS